MPSPTNKLQICKGLSDAPSIRKSTIRILGVKGAALPPTGKSQIETGKNFANAPAEVISASTNEISQSENAAVPSLAQQLQPDTAKNSSVTMHIHETSKVNQLAATVATLPRSILQNDYNKKPSNVPIMANQASGLAGATAPLITPKLEIGNMKDSYNPLSNPAYTRALLIKQQEQLLQQFKLGSSQQQRQEQQLYIKGPGKVLPIGVCFSILFSVIVDDFLSLGLFVTAPLQFQLCLRMMTRHRLSRWEQGASSASLILLSGHKGMLAVMPMLLQSLRFWHATMCSTAGALNLFTDSLSLPSVLPAWSLGQRTDH